ncbi:MAG: type II toxin-antitoxin system RelE family toxin [Halothece sp.]
MKVEISKSANKFLEKLESSSREAVLEKIGFLKESLEKQEVYPPEELDIKKLKGRLKGFSRIRVGKLRIIFQTQRDANRIIIYEINFRGSVYRGN